jgi:hypothetical protein
MEQKNGHAFKEEQIDWNALAKAGIGRENWNRTVTSPCFCKAGRRASYPSA